MISGFQRSAFQNNAFQIDVTVAGGPGGTIVGYSGAYYTRKRFYELLAELRAESERGLKRGQKPKVKKIAKDAARLAEEAVAERIVNETNARQLAELVNAAQLATKTSQAMKFALQIKIVLEQIREQEEEEEEFFMLGIL